MSPKHSIFLSPKASASLTQAAAKKNVNLKLKKNPETPHAARQLTALEARHVQDMLQPQPFPKGKGKSKAPTARRRDSFEWMGNEHHESVKQPSFLGDSQSGEEALARGTRQRDEPEEHPSAAPSKTTPPPGNEDIIDALLDKEIQEVRLFLMNTQKGDVMRRIVKRKAKGRMNYWKVDAYRVLMAYSKDIEDFEAIGGVVQLDFMHQTNPLVAVSVTGGDSNRDISSIDSNLPSEAPKADGGKLEQAGPAGARWMRIFVAFVIAMAAGGALAYYIFAFDDITALTASLWFLKQFIALDRHITIMVESAKALLVPARPLEDFCSMVATVYTAGRSFFNYAHTSMHYKIYHLIQVLLEFILSCLEGLRDHTAAAAQGTPSNYYQ